MAPKPLILVLVLILVNNTQSASIIDRSYEYLVSIGRNVAPSILSIFECVGEPNAWDCAKDKALRMLDFWDSEVDKQRRSWEEEADAEVRTSGRSIDEPPSKIGREITNSLNSLGDMFERGMERALSKKHDSGGIDSITISASEHMKKKKKPKPPKIHLIHPLMMPIRKLHKQEEKGRAFGGVQSWVVGERSLPEQQNSTPAVRNGRGLMSNVWSIGEEALETLANDAVASENADNGITDKSSWQEQRGKKKKKKKAILKLLILGAVLKAKIGTLLQILTFKLQVKFFIVAVLGLAINLARLWIDLKNKHSQQPQKIVYYEHAQHQHHYDHEEEEHGWGPWSRSIFPDETDPESSEASPYKAQERDALLYNYNRPLTRV